MIELKYDEDKNNLKLPKNIRQVGKPGEKIKIYVEDYVITYINQIARESTDKQRLAVLLGKNGKNKEDTVAFINGAVEAKEVVVQEDQVVFTSEIWTQIYDEIGQYFHNTEVVGWFLTRPGKSLGINDKVTKVHVDNFPGTDKALFIMDPLDHDEAFYIYRQGELMRQDGYYIYYERNEDMQNYMVDHKSGESTEQQAGNAFLKKKEEIMERRQAQKKEGGKIALFSKLGTAASKKRENTENEKKENTILASEEKTGENEKISDEEKGNRFSGDLYKGMKRASSLVVTFAILFALIFGFTQLNRRQTQEVSNSSGTDMIPVDVAEGDLKAEDEAADNAVADNDGTVNDPQAAAVDASASGDISGNSDVLDSQDVSGNTDESVDGGTSGQNTPDGADTQSDTDLSEENGNRTDVADAQTTANNTGETEVPVQNVIRQYEVREGDTLAGISEKFYSDYKYIELIQEMNQIEDPDMIYPGMMLNLPD
ncbi:MAG: LysM peptidoglycan-binding domain-containing protein [Clostridiales bacterium]|nr:LysM peptidoglycan-binding domain-containing protein [Clostridiales bacterium]